MSNLKRCLRRLGIPEHEAAILRGAAAEYQKDGETAKRAAVLAIEDVLAELARQRESVVAQVRKAGGLPEGSVDAAALESQGQTASVAQQDAGNYPKGHFQIGPEGATMEVSFENAAGERRRPEWPPLADHYGYFKKTVGFDKDHLDLFIAPGTPPSLVAQEGSTGTVYVVNQTKGANGEGGFDEHKVLLGVDNLVKQWFQDAGIHGARAMYLRNYEPGWTRFSSIVSITWAGFRRWATDPGPQGPKGGALTPQRAAKYDEEAFHAIPEAAAGKDPQQADPQAQRDLFSAPTLPGTSVRAYSTVIVAAEKQRTVKLPKTRITNYVEAAMVFAQLNTSPRERFQMVGTDARGKPIAFYDMFAGTVTQTSVFPREVWTVLYQTPGVKQVWFAHNHPSGLPRPSNADDLLTQNLTRWLTREHGIEYRDHLIIAGSKAYSYALLGPFTIPEPPAASMTLPVVERVVKRNDTPGPAMTSPGRVRDYLRAQNIQEPGLLLLNAQHAAIGWWPMSVAQMGGAHNADEVVQILQMIGRSNPSAVMIYAPQGSVQELHRAATSLKETLENADVRVLDAFLKDGDRYMSLAERGLMEPRAAYAPGTFQLRRGGQLVDMGPLSREAARLVREYEALEALVDRAYETGAENAEDLDAQLAVLRERITGVGEEMLEDEPDADSELSLEHVLAGYYTDWLKASPTETLPFDEKVERAMIVDAARDAIEKFGGRANTSADERVVAAMRDAYLSAAARRDRIRGAYHIEAPVAGMHPNGVHWELRGNTLARALGRRLHVVRSALDLPAHAVRELMEKGALRLAKGYWDIVTGEVYLVAGNLQKGEAEQTLVHEAVGHLGVMNVLGEEAGKEFEAAMLDIYASRAGPIRAAARIGYLQPYAFDLRNRQHRVIAAMEYVAHQAERGEEPNLWQRMVALLRSLLRKAGFVREWTENDILRLLQLSRSSLENGGESTFNGMPAWQLGEAGPLWYSALERAVEKVGTKRAPAAQWAATIAALPGVKKDELGWSGVQDWLAAREGMVAKEEVLAYLRDNGVRLEDTVLGDPGKLPPELVEWDQIVVELDALGFDVLSDAGHFHGIYHRRSFNEYLVPAAYDEYKAEGAHVKPLDSLAFTNMDDALRLARRLEQLSDVTRDMRRASTRSARPEATARARHEAWQLPGGRNYRNLLITAPMGGQKLFVQMAHFEEWNIVAFVRVNERRDVDGKRVLFVEEIQSDWAEQGRKKGFGANNHDTLLRRIQHLERDGMTADERRTHFTPGAVLARYPNSFDRVISYQEDPTFGWSVTVEAVDSEGRRLEFSRPRTHSTDPSDEVVRQLRRQLFHPHGPKVAAGPFVAKTEAWVSLALKRVIRYAADHGFERVAWTTGEQQNRRYGLEKHLERLRVEKYVASGYYGNRWNVLGTRVPARGSTYSAEEILARNLTDEQLADTIGDEKAAHVMEQFENEGSSEVVFTGDDLKLGGDGMRAFYDRIVPNVANDVLKKLGGARVLTVTFEKPDPEATNWRVAHTDPGNGVIGDQLGFDITPAMSDVAIRGLPMFQLREFPRTGPADWSGARYEKDGQTIQTLDELRRAYFTPGNIVHGGSGARDRVLKYAEGESAVFPWSVTVQEVVLRNGEWEPHPQHGRIRTHATEPTRAELQDVLTRAGWKPVKAEVRSLTMERFKRTGGAFQLRGNTALSEAYGIRDGRVLGMARRAFQGGVWDVYLANGTNENLFERGQFRRAQAGSLGEVQRLFAREGLELRVTRPRNTPVPDRSLFDRDWVAPGINSWLQKAIVYFQNRLLLPELYERKITEAVGPIPESAQAHREARLAHPRAAGKIADFDHDFVEPIVELMKEHKLTVQEVGRYLYARHAPERNAAIEAINPDNPAGSGMTDERAAQVIEGFRAEGKLPGLQQIGDLANRVSRFREAVMVDKGLAKQEIVTLLRAKYPNYVPLKELAEDEYAQSEIAGGYQVGRQINQAFGRFSEAQAEFILPGLIAQAKGTISAGENAEVLRALLRQVSFAPNPDVWKIQRVTWRPYIDRDTGEVRYAPRPIQIDANYSSRAISVPVDGERHVIVVDDLRMARAFKASGLPVGEFSQMIGAITRFYALTATAANPEFVVTNLMRDFQQAMIRLTGERNTELARKVAKDMPRALWGAFRGLRAQGQISADAGTWHRWYRRYIEAGGHVAYRGINNTEQQHKDFLTQLADVGIYPESVGGLEKARLKAHRAAKVTGAKAFAKMVVDVNGAVENALRLSSFKNMIEAGFSEKDAAFVARNVTVDFNLRGEAGSRIGAYFMFFNANIQGTALLFRSVVNHPKIQALALFLFLLGMFMDWSNRERAEKTDDGRNHYDNIAPYMKERNLIVMGPDGKGAVTIPLPFGFNVFYVAGVNAMSVLSGAQTPLDAAAHMFVTTINAFSPFGQSPTSPEGALQLISPTFSDTAVQAMTNRNFMDRAIVPERPRFAAPQADAATYFPGTPEPYIQVAGWLNRTTGGNDVRPGMVDVSPNMLQHWARSIFGGAGAFYTRAAEYTGSKVVGTDVEVRNVPFVRRFYYESQDFELSHRFYENLRSAEVAHLEVRRAMQSGDREGAAIMAGEFEWERKMYGEAQDAERRVSAIRKQMAEVRRNPRLSDDDRKARLEKMQEQSRQTMMRFNSRIERPGR